jgi:hypothetical protein
MRWNDRVVPRHNCDPRSKAAVSHKVGLNLSEAYDRKHDSDPKDSPSQICAHPNVSNIRWLVYQTK